MRPSTFVIATVSVAAVMALMPGVANARPDADAPKADAAIDPNSDIVVTARRRAETLLDVPIAVTAFSADRLEKTG
ncbi:hypothetical protein, partial [Pseudomonas sp. JAI120]|uniref:hypothetical protein n=1 Tax=Pseudomonas sp. JAI120 TaxID=2723063 RepID=UPI0030EE0B6B